MEQLTQNLKDGHMQLLEVPFPALGRGQVLVRNHFSLISAGTEGKTVKDARLGYIGKARARKEEVKKVIQTAKVIGLRETYRLVMNKLDAPSALGYSCSGEVIAVADDVHEFAIGDRVACGGSTAVHAEVVAVPVNLCVKTGDATPLKEAAFTTVGAIALQGVRQADLKLGETCAVIGLGLVGQITLQLLQASGVKVFGIDIDSKQVALAVENGADFSFHRDEPQLESIIMQHTGGFGVDAVIITAATASTDPVDLAGILCRRKASVIIVGAVPTGFARKNYYIKELELKMSCSYGPGRYDADYEERGIDYPYEYVRWTENRNMEAFVALLEKKKIDLSKLITHTFPFHEAPKAYDLILSKAEAFSGIVLEYDSAKTLSDRVHIKNKPKITGSISVGMIGAGSFGQNFLLPALQGKATLTGIATARANNARNVADKFGFTYCTGNANDIIHDPAINTIFIATRHDSHGAYVLGALKEGKSVFTEKPLCIHPDELEAIREQYPQSAAHLMVGFNRRFAPLAIEMKKQLNANLPSAINYRINAGIVPKEHWTHDPASGGGRIIGEVCHFIDFCSFITESLVVEISAHVMNDASQLQDTVSISLKMLNGSIASISYFSNGNKDLSKEYIEVFNGGLVTVLDDFKELTSYGPRGTKVIKSNQDKGHKQEIAAFIDCIKEGKPTPVSFENIYNSTLSTFKVIESIKQKGINLSVAPL
ncbi:MAG: bi-domain-containing oxidoreductase [Bacteroidetes bacterium]|nr:bi-domain-containing oxidoreductase [Bacteroidota bacterium]